MRSDDLAPLLAAPQGDPTAIRGGQGVVVAWNPLTAENVIRFRGTDLVNLPTHATSTEVLQIKPGDSVVLHIWGSGATATIYVVGRITTPGTPQAGSFMELFGVESASTNPFESTSSGTYTDLTTPGPAVTVDIGQTGQALVVVSADITLGGSGQSGVKNGYMSYAISGATTRAATDDDALILWHALPLGEQLIARASAVSWRTGLTSGANTFTAKYRSNSGPATFARCNITVFPF